MNLNQNFEIENDEDLLKAIEISLTDVSNLTHQFDFSNQIYLSNIDKSRVKAIKEFNANTTNQISVKPGDVILLTDMTDQNWWKGININGAEGMFPSNVVSFDLNQDLEESQDSTNKMNTQSINLFDDYVAEDDTIEDLNNFTNLEPDFVLAQQLQNEYDNESSVASTSNKSNNLPLKNLTRFIPVFHKYPQNRTNNIPRQAATNLNDNLLEFDFNSTNYQFIQNDEDLTYEHLLDLDRNVRHTNGLNQHEIDSLPTFDFKITDQNSDENTCPICYNEYIRQVKLSALVCSHKFHKICINEWLKKSRLCPLCKKDAINGK